MFIVGGNTKLHPKSASSFVHEVRGGKERYAKYSLLSVFVLMHRTLNTQAGNLWKVQAT
jgi:hypothetical protein